MLPKIKPFENINPQIYAYITPNNLDNAGFTKIGYTERQSVEERVKQQTHTANVKAEIKWHEKAQFLDGSGKYFTDHDFHDYLVRFGNIKRKPNTEWFQVSPDEAHNLFFKFVKKNYVGAQDSLEHCQYVLRDEQREAVDRTIAYYDDSKNFMHEEFLWNAKPRFGKTLTSYDFMRRINATNVLIVTNRPSIANSWYEDFQKFIGWQTGYVFVSESDALKNTSVFTRDEYLEALGEKDKKIKGCVAFESLQGLKGSVYFGGVYDKLKWILDTDWDLLIIDEAHEGVDTYKTDTAFENIKRKFTLHLSGTPFKAIANGKFAQKQIFNWSFTDEQEAKENWQGEGYNPYAKMPKMSLYTYQMSKIIQDRVNKGMDLADGENIEYAFDLNEFFSTNDNGKFKYEKDIKKFLNALCEQTKFPFSTPELRAKLAHTFWLFSRVDSVKAMAKLLKKHPVFENYEVIVAAGDGKTEEVGEDNQQSKKSYDKVKEAIATHDKTITLSVGQLTTGVTIPEWTAVFMLSNMRSPAEYIQAAFRAQNPYTYTKDGKYYQKENAYIFDFSPERTLLVYDEFANSLYSSTTRGNGTKEERRENVKRLINFFSVYAEDEDGEMVELDADKVLTMPISIKTEEVIKRGFMSNFLFANIGNVYAAPAEIKEILQQIKPEYEQGPKKGNNTIENIEDVHADDKGEIKIPEEVVVTKTQAVFGEKVYESVPSEEDIKKIYESTKIYAQQENGKSDLSPERKVAAATAEKIIAALKPIVETKAKEEYGLKEKEVERINNKISNSINTKLRMIADKHIREKKILEIEKIQEIEAAQTPAQIDAVHRKYDEKAAEADKKFTAQLNDTAEKVMKTSTENIVVECETRKEKQKQREVDGDIRARLRGFARTIPSFIMAYGDENLKLSNFEEYPEADVFKEVTSINVEDFVYLRDGGPYIDKETGETKHFEGRLFDEVVFDNSVQEFLKKKRALANYFNEQSEEDIFDYIPPQETNQIFTPKAVVKMMVDQLEKNEPNIFSCPDKTFVDFYMKSGLYITEIVKRLYRNPLIKSLYPNDKERIKHILECQVFGFAPTRIIYDIAMSYVFGFDESGKEISRHNFFAIDTLPYAENGTLQKLINKKLGDRIK